MQEHLKLLGCTVRDRITGLTGVVTQVAFDINGQVFANVNAKYDEKEGKLPNGVWMHVHRLETTNQKTVMPAPSFEISQRAV
jgi:hypothetical protein